MHTFRKLPIKAPNAAAATYQNASAIMRVNDLSVPMNPYGQ